MEPEHLDILQELINIGAGRATETLNCLLNSHIELKAPAVKWLPNADVREVFEDISSWGLDDLSIVMMPVIGQLNGNAQLVFTTDDADKLIAASAANYGQDVEQIDGEAVLNEVGNILINGLIGTLGNLLQINLAYRIPTYRKEKIGGILFTEQDCPVIFALIQFEIKELDVKGNFILTFEVESVQLLKDMLRKYLKEMIAD